jgi:DNA topoisomerase IA
VELAEMIRQAEADLKKADTDVDVTDADVHRAQQANAAAKQRQVNMRATLSWLRQQAEHAEQAEQARIVEPTHVEQALVEEQAVIQERFGKPVPEVKQSDLCLMALEHLGRPSTTTEIREYLQREGYTYDQSQIRSALKYLGRKKSAPVESPRTGVWRLTRPNPPELPTATMTLNGTGRSP